MGGVYVVRYTGGIHFRVHLNHEAIAAFAATTNVKVDSRQTESLLTHSERC